MVGLPRRVGVRDRQDGVVRGDGADLRGLRCAAAGWPRNALLAVAAVVGLTAVNYRGITRTARLARVLVALSVAGVGVFVAVAAAGEPCPRRPAAPGGRRARRYGVLQSAGLLFFAFAGYARIATLGEEVREPERTIPRAIPSRWVSRW